MTAAFATGLALTQQSVIDLWHDLGSITTPALLIPVGTALLGRGRIGPRWMLATILAPMLVTFAWVMAKTVGTGYPGGIEPIYVGLAVSLAIWGLGLAFRSGATPDSNRTTATQAGGD